MPRLFTGLEIPPDVTEALTRYRGGLRGARWVEPGDYHVTLRFIGDVERPVAEEIESALAGLAPRGPVPVALDRLESFGGRQPRALFARVVPSPALAELQGEQESLMRRIGLKPETRRFTPHVTLARLKGSGADEVASHIEAHGAFPALAFTAERFVLYSAKESTGGGPYRVVSAYPLD